MHDAADQDGEAQVERDLARLHGALLTGEYVAVQDERGHLFTGTEAEAAEHMMEAAGRA